MASRNSPFTKAASFDRIARLYRWMEYLTFGPFLQRCRLHFVSRLQSRQRAVVFGDGDGRFLSILFEENSELYADAVDTSGRMLALLQQRSRLFEARLETHQIDALEFKPSGQYDLIVTHFFLDCLTNAQVEQLIANLQPHLAPGAIWILSEFGSPANSLRYLAQMLVRSLYFAFHMLTGLRSNSLPDYTAALETSGFRLTERHTSLGGLLVAEVWQLELS